MKGTRKFNGKVYTYKKTCFSDSCVDKMKKSYKQAGYSVRVVTPQRISGGADVYYRRK